MMSFDLWYRTSADGRRVKYGYKELSDGVAAISVTVEGRSVMILQRSLRAPMTREEVEAVFGECHEASALFAGHVSEFRHSHAALEG